MGSTCKRRADRKFVFLTFRKEAFLIFLFLFEHILGLVSFSGCVQVSPLEGSRRKAADGGGDGFRSGGWEWAWQIPVVPLVYEYETHVDYRGELVKSGHVRP